MATHPKTAKPKSSIDSIPAIDRLPEDAEDEAPEAPDMRPQYRLTEQAYIEDRLLEPGALIRYEGTPGHHMKPANAAAKAVCKELWPNGRPEYLDPIQSMAIVGGKEDTPESRMLRAMSAQTEAVTALVGAVLKKAA